MAKRSNSKKPLTDTDVGRITELKATIADGVGKIAQCESVKETLENQIAGSIGELIELGGQKGPYRIGEGVYEFRHVRHTGGETGKPDRYHVSPWTPPQER